MDLKNIEKKQALVVLKKQMLKIDMKKVLCFFHLNIVITPLKTSSPFCKSIT